MNFFFFGFTRVSKVSQHNFLCLIFFPSVFQMEVKMEIRLPLLWFCGSSKCQHDIRNEYLSLCSVLCIYLYIYINICIYVCSYYSNILILFQCFLMWYWEKNCVEFYETVAAAFCFTMEIWSLSHKNLAHAWIDLYWLTTNNWWKPYWRPLC